MNITINDVEAEVVEEDGQWYALFPACRIRLKEKPVEPPPAKTPEQILLERRATWAEMERAARRENLDYVKTRLVRHKYRRILIDATCANCSPRLGPSNVKSCLAQLVELGEVPARIQAATPSEQESCQGEQCSHMCDCDSHTCKNARSISVPISKES
jgi:hypothetical protein